VVLPPRSIRKYITSNDSVDNLPISTGPRPCAWTRICKLSIVCICASEHLRHVCVLMRSSMCGTHSKMCASRMCTSRQDANQFASPWTLQGPGKMCVCMRVCLWWVGMCCANYFARDYTWKKRQPGEAEDKKRTHHTPCPQKILLGEELVFEWWKYVRM
jgi:hypothetical protein